MEIGGYDTIIDTQNPVEIAKQIMDFVGWKDCIIEKDEGEGFENDFFFYKDQSSKDFWDELGGVPALENTMIHFMIRDNQLTMVSDRELTNCIREKFC